jgi:hypothetical protein
MINDQSYWHAPGCVACLNNAHACIASYCVYSIVYHPIWQVKVHLINAWNSMKSIVLSKFHTIVIIGSCRTVDWLSPCQLPYIQVIFNSNKKSTDETLFKLYQTDRQPSKWNWLVFNTWNERFELACNCNVDFTIQGVPEKSTIYRNYPIVIIWMPEDYAEHKSA